MLNRSKPLPGNNTLPSLKKVTEENHRNSGINAKMALANA